MAHLLNPLVVGVWTSGLLWKQDFSSPVYLVTVARLDSKTSFVLATSVSREIIAFAAQCKCLISAKIT
ncbi:MAG: hypothetical protein K1X78_24950 [Verrucomicrobiaceae bacterium]|nr:hypothetical protein [Verrucomicrobiaceae bacterium]